MKYKKGDKVRFIKCNDALDSFTYGKVYTVREDSKHANHVSVEVDDNEEENGWHTVYFEPAHLGYKKMNNEVDYSDSILLKASEKEVLVSLLRSEFSTLLNSLSELSGVQKSKCLESMVKLNKLLEKLGE